MEKRLVEIQITKENFLKLAEYLQKNKLNFSTNFDCKFVSVNMNDNQFKEVTKLGFEGKFIEPSDEELDDLYNKVIEAYDNLLEEEDSEEKEVELAEPVYVIRKISDMYGDEIGEQQEEYTTVTYTKFGNIDVEGYDTDSIDICDITDKKASFEILQQMLDKLEDK
ncbi:MAG: hypothetical protein VZR53_02620 [Prevotella sp.]|nr:hypothetical protein [Prevotella sp.]